MGAFDCCWPYEDTISQRTSKVFDSVVCPVVLSILLVQFYANPFARREVGVSAKPNYPPTLHRGYDGTQGWSFVGHCKREDLDVPLV